VPGIGPVRALSRLALKEQATDVVDVSVRVLPGELTAAFTAESGRRRADATELRQLAGSIEGSSPDETACKAYYSAAAATAQAEADAYSSGCACVYALVVTGKLPALAALAGRPGIRVVDPAPRGVAASVVVFVGLLPEQTATVTPVASPAAALPLPAGKPPPQPSPQASSQPSR